MLNEENENYFYIENCVLYSSIYGWLQTGHNLSRIKSTTSEHYNYKSLSIKIAISIKNCFNFITHVRKIIIKTTNGIANIISEN